MRTDPIGVLIRHCFVQSSPFSITHSLLVHRGEPQSAMLRPNQSGSGQVSGCWIVIVPRHITARNLLIAALGCGGVYFVALHPWSGSLGGIVFLLLGWALPTAFLALLALGLAFLLPVSLWARVSIAFVLSFLAGLNTALPELPELFRYEQRASGQVLAKVPSSENRRDAIRFKRRPWPPLFVRPLEPQLRIGSDEGCMCMYFLETPIYSDRVQTTIARVAGRRATVVDYERSSDPSQENRDVHVDVIFWSNENEHKSRIEIVDHGKPIARFDQNRIPLGVVVERKGVGREKLAENFWSNAGHLFTRDNAWSYAVGRLAPDYYPERQVEGFLRDAGIL
jgi:hypothetical protein